MVRQRREFILWRHHFPQPPSPLAPYSLIGAEPPSPPHPNPPHPHQTGAFQAFTVSHLVRLHLFASNHLASPPPCHPRFTSSYLHLFPLLPLLLNASIGCLLYELMKGFYLGRTERCPSMTCLMISNEEHLSSPFQGSLRGRCSRQHFRRRVSSYTKAQQIG